MSNQVEHQNDPKRPQSSGCLASFWCATQSSADTDTDYRSIRTKSHPFWNFIGLNKGGGVFKEQ